MSRFNFANFLGGSRAEAGPATPAAGNDPATPAAATDPATPAAASGDVAGDETAAAEARGYANARDRIGAILSADGVGPANMAAALELALNTEVEPAAALAVLKHSTSATPTGFAAAMRGRSPNIGPAGGATDSDAGGDKAAGILRNHRRATGRGQSQEG